MDLQAIFSVFVFVCAASSLISLALQMTILYLLLNQ